MKSPYFKVLIGVIIIYSIYMVSQLFSSPDKAVTQVAHQRRAAVRARTVPESDIPGLHLNDPSDESILTLSGRSIFSFYQKPVITHEPPPPREPVRPPVETTPPRPPVQRDREPRIDISTPDPRLSRYKFVAYFSTPESNMIILQEGNDEEFIGSIGGIINTDIEILNIRNLGTGQDYVEINVVNSPRPPKKIYFNPIAF